VFSAGLDDAPGQHDGRPQQAGERQCPPAGAGTAAGIGPQTQTRGTRRAKRPILMSSQPDAIDPQLEQLLDLERRSLLAEQARQQAHALRTPLSVIDVIVETLRLESHHDLSSAERLSRIQGAAGSLATVLSDSVNATRFGDGPRYPLDITALAAHVVRALGGEVPSGGDGTDLAEVEPASFQAAVMHALRLIGIGTDCYGGDTWRAVLRRERQDGALLLSLVAVGPRPPEPPRERADLQLMALAARRVAEDSGGSLTLERDRALFRLPRSPTQRGVA
jgi:signal transduction histidine kinase